MASRRFIVTKSFSFDSAHQLYMMPEGHPCTNLHGHTYHVEVTLSALGLDSFGMVVDFNVFKELKEELDHKNLNDVIDKDDYGQPTAENISQFIWDWIDKYIWAKLGAEARKEITVVRVCIQETPNNRTELVLDSI